jgi:hypothetical protein
MRTSRPRSKKDSKRKRRNKKTNAPFLSLSVGDSLAAHDKQRATDGCRWHILLGFSLVLRSRLTRMWEKVCSRLVRLGGFKCPKFVPDWESLSRCVRTGWAMRNLQGKCRHKQRVAPNECHSCARNLPSEKKTGIKVLELPQNRSTPSRTRGKYSHLNISQRPRVKKWVLRRVH